MTEPRTFPYGGVPVYNPQSLSKTEALAQFHVRQAAFQGLMSLLREQRPSHVLIIGTRGMGKTTLLQRVRYGVEDDSELKDRYLALVFPEEQYNVNRLHHFLLNAVDALADALERMQNKQMVVRVEAFVEMVGKLAQEEIEERVPKFLSEIGQEIGKSLLLLVDNADRLFEMIENKEQWRLRELLSSRRDLTLFGATTQASDGIYGHDRAFFEFFKIYTLTPLTLAEVKDLLLRLSESVDEPEGEKGSAKRRVQEWLDADAARLRTLVQLTGGNPRTTVLLFHLVLDGLTGGAREYLEQLLDQCTPNYKGRVDELPAQAQQVLDAVALRWDPTTAMEVAAETRLETTSVSAQLTRLVRQGLLEKADPGDSKKALYQVSERFFNIWYLMRASRRVRAKLRWFVEFLRVFSDSVELEHMAWERLECFRSQNKARSEDVENAFAFLVASRADRRRVEKVLRRKYGESESLWAPYLDLVERPADGGFDPILETAREAVRAEPKNAWKWRALGYVLGKNPELAGEAETSYRKAIELDPRNGWFQTNLGSFLSDIPGRREEAEKAVRMAIDLDPKEGWFWWNLGCVLAAVPERREEAEAAYRKAIELDPTQAAFQARLGVFFGALDRREEGEAAIRRAIGLDPTEGWNRDHLAELLRTMPDRQEDAEEAARKAVELDPTEACFWNTLGKVLARERVSEAESAHRKATELDPMRARFWSDRGYFLAYRAGKAGDAEISFRRAMDIEPEDSKNLLNLGVLLYCEGVDKAEGLQYIRKACLIDAEYPLPAAILAACARGSEGDEQIPGFVDAACEEGFWTTLLQWCEFYPPFGKILLGICDLVRERDGSNRLPRLYRAIALAQLDDFPRASVALEDALVGDPIDLLAAGRRALEVFFAAAVRNGRVRDCLELLDKKEWKDAWRPIYEALQAVEAGSGEYLKRVAVEIRGPAMVILRRIAPTLPG